MSVNIQDIKSYLTNYEFFYLFRVLLGWNQKPEATRHIIHQEQNYDFHLVAEKSDFKIYLHTCTPRIYPMSMLKQLDARLVDVAAAHLTIFIDAQHHNQLWLWIKRQSDHATTYPTYMNKLQSGELLAQKVRNLYIDIEEELQKGIHLVDVIDRVVQGFDVERVTRAFYDGSKAKGEDGFKDIHTKFLHQIQNIPDEADRKWYTSIMLNRLMFVYFIQRKGLLDYTDPNSFNGKDKYLQNHLEDIQKTSNNPFAYYREFLLPLFQGLNQRNYPQEVRRVIGNVPYLNGGIFDQHSLEEKYPNIQISNAAFKNLFKFFTGFTWHLDDRPSRKDDEINPDVLGYIFEKYINQKEMGAYYTKEDITGYISRNTIIPYIFEQVAQQHETAFALGGSIWSLLQPKPEVYIYEAMTHGVLTELPAHIEAGIHDVSQRANWNQTAEEEYGLETETWREVVARRQHYHEIYDLMKNGKINSINDLITYNLDIVKFATDVITGCSDASLLCSFYGAITHVTILDPTCGSGAFLFAALNILRPLYQACLDRMGELVKLHERHEIKLATNHLKIFQDELDRFDKHQGRQYFILKSIIVKNLYGVDIMEEAIEICRLRFFLNLVAQLRTPRDLEPLPDIDFNVLAGNTLIGFTSLDEVRRVAHKLFPVENTEEVLALIERKAKEAERAEQAFRDCQAEGINVDASAKQALQAILNDLRDDLNPYLATEYSIGDGTRSEKNTQSEAYQTWLRNYQPFYWWIEFHKIMYDGGFDVIIGNPPYLDFKELKTEIHYKDFATLPTRNIYSLILERCQKIASDQGKQGYIVPVSSIATEGYLSLQQILRRRKLIFSSFDDRPSHLFDYLDKNTLSILLLSSIVSSSVDAVSTRLCRWSAKERDQLFKTLSYATTPTSKLTGCFPKIGSAIEATIWKKLFSSKPLYFFYSPKSKFVTYYSRKVNAFLQVLDFVPKVYDGQGILRPPSEFKELNFATHEQAVAVFCCLNSTLFRWFLDVTSDGSHLNRREIDNFPFDAQSVSSTYPILLALAKYLSENLQQTSANKVMRYKHDTLTVQCIFPKYSKSTIDEIDRVLAQHYGFTPEELDFIINYDIKYRMGRG
jgi:tRNA1(Val) A37 N6-methylase TrmN6